MKTKVYRVNNAKDEKQSFLVRAQNGVQAERFVSNMFFTASLASADDAVELASKGVKILDADAVPGEIVVEQVGKKEGE